MTVSYYFRTTSYFSNFKVSPLYICISF